MKRRYMFSFFYTGLISLISMACSKNSGKIEPYEQFVADPITEVGKKLVAGTNLIAKVHSDSTYQVVPGVQATELSYLSSAGLAMKLFVFEIDLNNPDISLETSTPNNAPAFAMQEMTKQATYEDYAGHKVWAGINADFFNTTNGTPQGIVYKEGIAIKTSVTDNVNTFFGILNNKKAVIGDQAFYPTVKDQLKEAVGGRVTLLDNGIMAPQSSATVEPRTCIGVNEAGDKVIMLIVDGRNFHYSNGMAYESLAQCMKALGAYDAINLDGGGSSTFFVRKSPAFEDGRFLIRNWPTDDGGKERAVANGILIISKAQ